MESSYENLLTCNFKDCYKEVSRIGYVTGCSHIFCENHGKDINNSCPACKKVFAGPHEIFETNLTLPKNTQKLMLAGQHPKDIIEIARAGIAFWEYQKKSESLNLKRKLEHYRKKLLESQKKLQETTKDKDARIEALEMQAQKLAKEKQDLNLELVTKSDELIKMGQKIKKLTPNFS